MGSHPSKPKKKGKPPEDRVDSGREVRPLEKQNVHEGEDDGDGEEEAEMPFFSKKSKGNPEAKKRLQHQMYLAKESPEPTFDLSGCELTDVPAGVYSLCKVLQKQALLLHNNWMTSLKGGGNLRDLAELRILDLHVNDLGSLPDDVSSLRSLQVLNLEQNKLKSIPACIGELSALQTFNVKGNKLKSFPECVCRLSCLRTLDISSNPHITRLPTSLAQVRTLESLILDANTMQYPPAAVCSEGTAAIMQFLCEESGQTYVPPSKVLLNVLDVPVLTSPTMNSPSKAVIDLGEVVEQYEKQKEEKRMERIRLEQQLEEEQRQQTQLAAHAAANKQHLIQYMAKDQARMEGELSALQQQKDKERHAMVDTLQKAEENAAQLVNELVTCAQSARRTEELLWAMEREREEAEQWWLVRAEEIEQLRKKEVLEAMQQILSEKLVMDQLIGNYMSDRERSAREQMAQADETDSKLTDILIGQQDQQARFVQQLLKEERLQREAFESLQLQKDACHLRLTGQIDLIEQELSQLSMLEVEQRELKVEVTMDVLEGKRSALAKLLVQLLDERGKREEELKKRMLEMDQQREDTQTDYWLVQYQRLMDKKPQALIDQESNMEIAVVEIMNNADAADYIPVFARHRISIETMCQLDEKDIQQMGVHELGLRKAILREAQKYREQQEEERAAAKAKNIQHPDEWLVRGPPAMKSQVSLTPSAPPQSPATTPATTPTTPPEEVTARFNSECVICMEELSNVLFLNCGHVCTCKKCSESVQECPLCRGTIYSRIKLTGGLQKRLDFPQ